MSTLDRPTSSFHVDDAFYDQLTADAAAFRADWPASDPADAHATAQFVFREARLIDDQRFDDWLGLFANDGLYWVPAIPGGGNPAREVSLAFDDVRRLEDRIYWLGTGVAFSQVPPSRTRRVIGNVETTVDERGRRLVRTNQTIHEVRPRVTHTYAAWVGHVLIPDGDAWRIQLKMTNLLDADHGHENLTVIL